MHRTVTVREVTASPGELGLQRRHPGCIERHPRPDRISIGTRADEFHDQGPAPSRHQVFEHRDGLVEPRYREVDVTVPVVVARREPPPLLGLGEKRAGGGRRPLKAFAVEGEHEGQLAPRRRVGKLDDVAVRDDDVDEAVEVEVGARRAEADEQAAECRDAVPSAHVQELAATFVAVEGERLTFVVRHPDVGPAVAIEVAQVDPHAAVRHALIIERDAGDEPLLRERAIAVVHVEKVVGGVVADIDIDVPVEIHVGEQDAETLAVGAQARLARNLDERAVPLVAIDRVGQALELAWRADVAFLGGAAAERIVLERPVHVAGEIQVEVAVAIEVGPPRTRTPAGIGRCRPVGHRGEAAVAEVAPELRRSVAGHDEIRKPVIVEVADRDTVRVERKRVESRHSGDTGEAPPRPLGTRHRPPERGRFTGQ